MKATRVNWQQHMFPYKTFACEFNYQSQEATHFHSYFSFLFYHELHLSGRSSSKYFASMKGGKQDHSDVVIYFILTTDMTDIKNNNSIRNVYVWVEMRCSDKSNSCNPQVRNPILQWKCSVFLTSVLDFVLEKQ